MQWQVKKKKLETNNDKINATYKTTDARTKMHNIETVLERSVVNY